MKELTVDEKILFLELVARMASSIEFKRKLDLDLNDILKLKKILDVETSDEARVLIKELKASKSVLSDTEIAIEIKKARAAEQLAQQRLEEMELKRTLEKAGQVKTITKEEKESIAIKYKESQQRLNEQENKLKIPSKEWQLPLEGSEEKRRDAIDRFRRDILYHGFTFIRRKYGASIAQTKFEAERLGIKVNWDVVKR